MLTKQNKNKTKTTENTFSTFTMTFMFAKVVAVNPATTCDHKLFDDFCLVSNFAFLGD